MKTTLSITEGRVRERIKTRILYFIYDRPILGGIVFFFTAFSFPKTLVLSLFTIT